jgi:hypothetical protein
MKYTSRAELLIDAGNSIFEQESVGLYPTCKKYGVVQLLETCPLSIIGEWEFPLAYNGRAITIEGKPVFLGDKLFDTNGHEVKIVAPSSEHGELYLRYTREGSTFSTIYPYPLTWDKPVMTAKIELPLGDLELWAGCELVGAKDWYETAAQQRLINAARDAVHMHRAKTK